MIFYIILASYCSLFALSVWLMPAPLEEGASVQAPMQQVRVTTGYMRSSMAVIAPEGATRRPGRLPPIPLGMLRALSTCDYCDTTGSWSKKDHCKNCGALRPA